jgi:thiol-disulfide isomerase/thioredoxin
MPAAPDPVWIGDARMQFYRQLLPQAVQIEGRRIPDRMIRPLDQGNDTYFIGYDSSGSVVGTLRDIHAKVTDGDACECDPMRFTIVMDREHRLTALHAATPLTKLGHVPFDDADMDRLLLLGRDPPAPVLAVRRVEAMVDATSGATVTELQPHVVEAAALTTYRVIGLVQDTRRAITGAPAAWDQARLVQILDIPDSLQQAQMLAEFIAAAQSEEAAVAAYRHMTRAYRSALTQGGRIDRLVESRFLSPNPPGRAWVSPQEMLEACYDLANSKGRFVLADRCAARLMALPNPPEGLARLDGTLSFQVGEYRSAEPLLRRAGELISVQEDPTLHRRLANTLFHNGKRPESCQVASELFVEHPLLEGAVEALQACPDPVVVTVATLRQRQQEKLLALQGISAAVVPELELEDAAGQVVNVALHAADQLTVLLFFASWCPHCRVELPRVNAFFRDKPVGVRVLGIRTSVERETESFESFLNTFDPAFPIYTDPVMSLAFSKVVRTLSLTAELPLLLVVDGAGRVRFKMPVGDHRDTARELTWAVEASR